MLAGGGPAVYEFQVQDGSVTADGWHSGERSRAPEWGARVIAGCLSAYCRLSPRLNRKRTGYASVATLGGRLRERVEQRARGLGDWPLSLRLCLLLPVCMCVCLFLLTYLSLGTLRSPPTISGLPRWFSEQRICLQHRRGRFDPWVGEIPWKRA